MKKLFIISLILLGVTLLFLGVYNFAFKKDKEGQNEFSNKESSQSGENRESILPEFMKETKKITTVSDRAVMGATFEKDSEMLVYYTTEEGIVWKMNSRGNEKQQMTSAKITGLKSVLWSPDRSKALIMSEKNGQNAFYANEYVTEKSFQLKSGMDLAVWDNLGAKLIYKYFDPASQTRSINISNLDGSEWQKLTDIEFKKISIVPVPMTSLISYWNLPDANEETKLMTIGSSGGAPKSVFSGKYGGDYLWSPDGKKALVSALASKGNKMTTLGLLNLNGGYDDLKIPTLASKCAWSFDSKTIYYALPGGIPDGFVMPNDYQEGKFNTEDTFWKINIAAGKPERIIDASDIPGKYDSSNLFLSPAEDALYFINKIDGKLYRIEM